MNPRFHPDYGQRRRWRRLAVLAILIVLTIFLPLVFLLGSDQLAELAQEVFAPARDQVQDDPREEPDIADRELSVDGVIQPGETFGTLLKEYLSAQQIHSLAAQSREIFPLSKLRAGQPYTLCSQNDKLVSFLYDIDRDQQLSIRCVDEGCDVDRVPIPYTIQTGVIRGTISSSLFEAVATSGEEAELAIALADIFAWDIDFIRDIQEGDSFSALVEKRFRAGQPAGYGRIVAAEFRNQGELFQAILFKDGDQPAAYYTPEGKALRKAFLKAPLNFSRISSGFTRKRFHPVLHIWRPHLAIDYAAPTGTPVRTVADGTVVRRSYDRCNGNLARIRHANGYETCYIHLSRFGKKLKVGKRVQQGDVIGYVGSTGLATGPHLDFRMFRSGQPINPASIKSIPTEPVSKASQVAFQAEALRLLTELNEPDVQQAQVMKSREHRTP